MSITLTPQQVGAMIGRSAPYVRDLAAAGKIPGATNGAKKGKRAYWRFEERIIKAWVRELKAAAKPKTIAPAEVVEPEWHPGRETQVPEAKPAVTGLLTTLAEMNLRLASLEDKVDRLLSVWS